MKDADCVQFNINERSIIFHLMVLSLFRQL